MNFGQCSKYLPLTSRPRCLSLGSAIALGCLLVVSSSFSLVSCSDAAKTESAKQPVAPGCKAVEGVAWSPGQLQSLRFDKIQESGSPTLHTDVIEKSATVIGAAQGWSAEARIPFDFDLPFFDEKFESFELEATLTAMPSKVSQETRIFLVALNDGFRNWVKFPIKGVGRDCARAGLFLVNPSQKSADSQWTPNPECQLAQPSVYRSHNDWFFSQLRQEHRQSWVSSFPNCDWRNDSSCYFQWMRADDFRFTQAQPNTRFHAEFVVIDGKAREHENDKVAKVQIRVTRKMKPSVVQNSQNLGISLKVVLVGQKNIQMSRTAEGKANLDQALQEIQSHFKISEVKALEWGCGEGGDAFSTVSREKLSELFTEGSGFVRKSNGSDYTGDGVIPIFIVSQVSTASQGQTLLGLSSGIPGGYHDRAGRGLVLATFDRLNDRPSEATSEKTAKQRRFLNEFAISAAHELGHFLGLSHLSEATGDIHDSLSDTPECRMRSGSDTEGTTEGQLRVITAKSCSTDPSRLSTTHRSCVELCPQYSPEQGKLCPEVSECAFNHLMWWTDKSWSSDLSQTDANNLSVGSRLQVESSTLWRW